MAHPPHPAEKPVRPSLADVAQGTGVIAQRRRHPVRRPPSRLRRRLIVLGVLALLIGIAGLVAIGWFLDDQGRSPREWAPYIERRAQGNNSLFVQVGDLVARTLLRMDRLPRPDEPVIPPSIGAAAARSGTPPTAARLVLNPAQLAAALAQATPGQVIQLVPGTWRIDGRGLALNRPGTAAAPITLRAERLGDVTILSSVVEAFKISAPYWTIENLILRGVCGSHSDCEHAVHVVGAGSNAVIRNNRFEDLNAHIKINGEDGLFPDNGRIEGNTFINAEPRNTRNPITPIDLVAASNWRIAGNFIADIQRQGLGSATYGAFIKGSGEGNVMERNMVLCEWKLRRRSYSPNIGLSIGGGGSFPDAIKRDLGRSGNEQSAGVIRDNFIAFCNDVGIYVNKGHRSVIAHNTVLDTAGIGIRFADSTAEVVGNLVDGPLQIRDNAVVRARDNETTNLLGLFVGLHPVHAMFRDAARLDLRWRNRPNTITTGDVRPDLCGAERTGRVLPGAFEDFSRCREPAPTATPATRAPAAPEPRPPTAPAR